MKTVRKKRRLQGKTDYKARRNMLKSGRPRILFRKTNRYVICQYVKSEEARDKIIVGVNSRELTKYGWPSGSEGSLKSLPASYLSGVLLGKKIQDVEDKVDIIFDFGLMRTLGKSKVYAFAKGILDSGIKIEMKENIFPDEKTLNGEQMKNKIDVQKIKLAIEAKYK